MVSLTLNIFEKLGFLALSIVRLADVKPLIKFRMESIRNPKHVVLYIGQTCFNWKSRAFWLIFLCHSQPVQS